MRGGLVQDLLTSRRNLSRASIRSLMQLARAGDAEATYALAIFAREGLRAKDGTVLVRRDPRKVRLYIHAAAAAGVRSAMTPRERADEWKESRPDEARHRAVPPRLSTRRS